MPKCLFLQHPLSSCKDKVNLYWMWRNPGVQTTCVLINLKALNLACDGAYKPVWLPFQLSLVLTRLNLWFLLICSHSTPGPVWEHQCGTQSVRRMKLSSDTPRVLVLHFWSPLLSRKVPELLTSWLVYMAFIRLPLAQAWAPWLCLSLLSYHRTRYIVCDLPSRPHWMSLPSRPSGMC